MNRNVLDPESMLHLSYVEYHVLLALKGNDLHGYGIIKDVEARTRGGTSLEAGTLYGALRRLADQGLVQEAPSQPEESGQPGRPRRRYRISNLGRRVLSAEARRLLELVELAREKDLLGPGDQPATDPGQAGGA